MRRCGEMGPAMRARRAVEPARHRQKTVGYCRDDRRAAGARAYAVFGRLSNCVACI